MDINGGRLSFDAYIRDSDFQRQINAMEQRIVSMSSTVVNESKRMDNEFQKMSGGLAKLASAYLSFNAAQGFVMQMIAVRSQLKDTETSFKVFLGSAERASDFMDKLGRHAYNSVFEFKDIASGAASLLSFGEAADNIVPVLERLSNIAAGTNRPLSDMIDLYNKASTSTKLATQDLQQMQRNGIPIVRQLAESYSMTEQQIWDMASAGKIGFKDMEVALEGLTSAGGMFFNMMEEKSKNISDRIGLLQDVITNMFNELGAANEGTLRQGIDAAIVLVEHYNEIIKVLKMIAVTYGIYRAALIANTLAMSGMTAMELIHYGRLVLVEKAQRMLNITTAMNPYVAAAAALAALASATLIFANNATAAERAQSRLNDLLQEANMSVVEQTTRLNDLIRIAKDDTRSKGEREKAIKDINNISPEYLNNITLETIGTKNATAAINEYVAALKKKAFEEAAFNERVEIERERMRVNKGEGTNWVQRTGMWLYGLTGGDADAMREAWKKDALGLLDARTESIDEAIKDANSETGFKRKVDEFTEMLASPITNLDELLSRVSNRNDVNRIKQAIEGEIDALAPGDAKIREYQEKLKKVVEIEKQYSLSATTKGIDELEKWGDKKLDILIKISDREADILARGMTQNERELQETRNHYTQLRRIIEEHNAKAPASQRISSSILGRVASLEEQELGNIRYRQETELMKKEIERQTKIWEEYERYKTETSAKYAEERFEKDMDEINSLKTRVAAEVSGLTAKMLSIGLTGVEVERLNAMVGLMAAIDNKEQAGRDTRFKAALQAAKDFADQRLEIEEAYQRHVEALGANATKSQLAQLKQGRDAAMAALIAAQVEASDEFRAVAEDLDYMSVSQARNAIKAFDEVFNSIIDGAEEGSEEVERLREIYRRFKDEAAKSSEERFISGFVGAASELDRMVQLAMTFDDNMANTLRTMGEMVKAAANIATSIGSLMGESGKALSKSGGYGAIIGAVLSLAGTVVDAFDQARRRRDQEYSGRQQYLTDLQLRQTEAVTKALERQLELINEIYGADRLIRYNESLKTIQENYTAINRQLSGLYQMTEDPFTNAILGRLNRGDSRRDILKAYPVFSKEWDKVDQIFKDIDKGRFNVPTLSTLSEDITKAREELEKLRNLSDLGKVDAFTDDLIRQLEEQVKLYTNVLNSLRAETTGTTFDSLISIADNAFRQSGEYSANAWTDGFDKVMDDYLMKRFNREFLEQQMQGWYELMDELAGDGLDSDERNLLRDEWKLIKEAGDKRLEELRDLTGIKSGSSQPSQNTLSGAYARASQESIDLLSGQTGAMRIHLAEMVIVGKEQINFMDQQLAVMARHMDALIRIEHNTGRSADANEQYLPYLRSMDTKMGDNLGLQLRAAGKFGY